MAKQYSNSAKSRAYGGGSGSISQGANLETLRYQNEAALRNHHDDDAEFFNDIAKGTIGPSGRPRGIGANLAYGVSKGLAHGARSRSTEERKENYDKYANVMDYLQEVNNASLEQNQWFESRENARREMLPQVMSYIDNIDRLDPQSQRIMAQDMLAQYGNAIGQDYKLSSIDGSNPFLMTIQGSNGQQMFDIRSLFAGDDANQQAIAMKMPAYQIKLQEERADKLRKFQLEEEKLSLMRDSMNEKNSVQREKLEQTTRRNDQSALKQDIKLSETLGKKIDASREFLTIVPKIEKILKYHSDVFQSAIDATWRESDNPGYTSNFLKDVQNRWNPEKVAALTSMIKYINKMTLDVANGFARPNMFIEKIGSKAVPNLDMSPQGFKQVLLEMKQENEASLKNNLARFKLLESDVGSGIADQYQESTNEVMGGQQESPLSAFGRRVG